jgi:hypothetical protein
VESPLASPRALRRFALGIVVALVLAAVCFYAATLVRFAALFAVPMEGMFGATMADFQLRPGELAELRAHQRSLYATANALAFASLALPVASAAAAGWCGWQTRDAFRHWHWLSFFGFGCVVGIMSVGIFVQRSKFGMLGLLGLDAVALVCALADLARRQYGAPGRVIAWSTSVLSVAAAIPLSVAALGLRV